jgi:fumarate reductase subunit D
MALKRSHKPIFWSLFGAGGMLSALFGPALIFVTGIAMPLGMIHLGYDQAAAFARSVPGAIALFLVITLFLFHGCHRLYHCLHDFGIHVGAGLKALFHGFAAAGGAAAAALLLLLR